MMDKPKFNQYRAIKTKKYCKECGVLITKELQVRTGQNYIQGFCRPCRRIISNENSKKKAEIIRANPLW